MSDDERIAIALSALAEVVDPGAVGPLVDASVPVPGVVDLRFATTLPGYVDWFWTVSTSAVEGVPVTVLELQLLPGDGALVAPAWVPWEDRLAEWRRTHADEAAAEDLDDDVDDDDEDLDDDGLDADGSELDDVLDDDVLDDDELAAAEPAAGEAHGADADGRRPEEPLRG